MPVKSEKYKFIFFQNPRTGSTMLESVLMDRLGGELFPTPDSWENRMEIKHLTYNELIQNGCISKVELNQYFKFVTIRNPYVKVVSDWKGGKKFYDEHKGKQSRIENVFAKETDTLEDYLKLILIPAGGFRFRRRLSKLLPEFVFVLMARLYRIARTISKNNFLSQEMDLVIKTEDLEEEFEKLCKRFSIKEKIKLPVINKTNQITQPHSSYHNVLTRKLVYHMYKDIIVRFDYTFDES